MATVHCAEPDPFAFFIFFVIVIFVFFFSTACRLPKGASLLSTVATNMLQSSGVVESTSAFAPWHLLGCATQYRVVVKIAQSNRVAK
tara:strand:+ start:235 stop:495 length:261 start_codon:yes stop_codon:yes gene_type:complete